MKISLKRKYAAVLPLILSIAVLLLLGCQAESQDGRSEFTDHAAELSRTKDAYNNKEEMPDDNPDCHSGHNHEQKPPVILPMI